MDAAVLNGQSPDEIQLSPETGLLNLTRKSDDHHVKVVMMIMAISPCITLSTSVGVVCWHPMLVWLHSDRVNAQISQHE